MFFKTSPEKWLEHLMDQYIDIVQSIREVEEKPYSYLHYCLKRQLEVELLDLSTLVLNVLYKYNITDHADEIKAFRPGIPITLAKVMTIRHEEVRVSVEQLQLLRITRLSSIMSHPSSYRPDQKYIFDNFFHLFWTLPFFTVQDFWRLIARLLTYGSTRVPKNTYFVSTFFHVNPVNDLLNNEGNIYEHLKGTNICSYS
jgi:hypothetical protein